MSDTREFRELPQAATNQAMVVSPSRDVIPFVAAEPPRSFASEDLIMHCCRALHEAYRTPSNHAYVSFDAAPTGIQHSTRKNVEIILYAASAKLLGNRELSR